VNPDVGVVVVTASQSESDLYGAVRAGVRGYISKSADFSEVLKAIRAAYEGLAMLSQEQASQLMAEFARQSYEETGLSLRQREILAGLTQAKTNREIAIDLDLAEKTVKNYMRGLFSALGCRDRTEAAILGIQKGLVPADATAQPENQRVVRVS
jgi:DNA-binding NarL/FixJ family response regulator